MASLHDLQWAVSHNSYDHPSPFDPGLLYDHGYRGFELDIWKCPSDWLWCINHEDGYQDASPKLGAQLEILQSALGPARRDPVFLHLDIKDTVLPVEFAAQLDAQLTAVLAGRLFMPIDLQDAGGAWNEWPDPASAAMKGRVIVVISGTEACKKAYAAAGPGSVVAFPDFDPYRPGKRRLIANTEYDARYLAGLFGEWRCERKSLLWRIYGTGHPATKWLAKFKDTGANMLALNHDGSVILNGAGYWPNPYCGA